MNDQFILYDESFGRLLLRTSLFLAVGAALLFSLAWGSTLLSPPHTLFGSNWFNEKWGFAFALLFIVSAMSFERMETLRCLVDRKREEVVIERRGLCSTQRVRLSLLDIYFIDRRPNWVIDMRCRHPRYSLIASTERGEITLIDQYWFFGTVRAIQDKIERYLLEMPGTKFSRTLPKSF